MSNLEKINLGHNHINGIIPNEFANLSKLQLLDLSNNVINGLKRFAIISAGLLLVIYLGANFIPSAWDAFQFTGATAAICIGFIFPTSIAVKDVHGIATRRDKMLAVLMIGLAVFANVIAIYSDAYALFKKNPSPTA